MATKEEKKIEVPAEPVVSATQLCDIKGYSKLYREVICKKFKGQSLTLTDWAVKLKEAKIINK